MKEYLAEIVGAVPRRDATNAMREYLQARALQTLQDRGAWSSIAFMGGTALRFLYRIPRFSEDLVFALEDQSAGYDFAKLMEAVKTQFEHEGYDVALKFSTKTTVNKAFIKFRGLEHELGLSPLPDQVFSIKVEVDTNPPAGAGLETTIIRRFVTLRLVHHDKSSLLAGKCAALLMREWLKGRDVYDLVWYLTNPEWPEPNEALLRNAFRQGGRVDLLGDESAWKAALVSRISQEPWDHVLSDADRFFERPEDTWMLERDSVLSVLSARGWKA